MKRSQMLLALSFVTTMCGLLAHAADPGTAFLYQGKLDQNGSPVAGNMNVTFRLFDAETAGSMLGELNFAGSSAVSFDNGRFEVPLDFGVTPYLLNQARWLEIAVDGTTLAPRQALLPAPFAMNTRGIAMSADGNLSIGTAASEARLHAVGAAANGMAANINNQLYVDETDNFVGVNRHERHTPFEYFGVEAPTAGNEYGGMYVRTTSTQGLPFYGYSAGTDGQNTYHSWDPVQQAWKLSVGAERITVKYTTGNVGIGTTDPQRLLDVAGDAAFSGNVGIGHSSPSTLLHVGDGTIDVGSTSTMGIAMRPQDTVGLSIRTPSNGIDPLLQFCKENVACNYVGMNAAGDLYIPNFNLGIGTSTPGTKLDVAGEITSTAVNLTSDRNAKEKFSPVDGRSVLEKVVGMEISEWQYKTQADVRHIGPVAQDFRAAFALGRDDKHIATVDADGVALAAIQGLNKKLEDQVQQKNVELDQLRHENQSLATRLAEIERLLSIQNGSISD